MDFDRKQLSNELLNDFNQKDNIDFDAEPGIPVKVLFPLILLAAIIFVVYAWQSDKIAISKQDGSEVPLIRASKEPVRTRPDDPGGMHIANRDKLIYDTISSDKEKKLPQVVRLLPKAEEPVSREIIKEGDFELPQPFSEDVKKPVKKKKQPIIKEVSKKPVKKKVLAKKEVLKKHELMAKDMVAIDDLVTVDDIKSVPVPTAKVKKVMPPKKTKIGYNIQLGSYRTESDVQDNWNRIKKKHASLLGDVQMFTQKADLGDKGIFYRLQIGQLKSQSKARAICQELIKKKQGCFVVKK